VFQYLDELSNKIERLNPEIKPRNPIGFKTGY
jgi:hypothetical protein